VAAQTVASVRSVGALSIRTDSTRRRSDALLALLICAATVLYLAQFPLSLWPGDEPKPLYQATRLLGGEVMYRDMFDLVLPGWTYLMAGLFWVFGTTLATARMTAAVMHGISAGVLFLICRQLAVRRELAGTAALAYLVVCQPAYPVASQHWLATALCVLLLAIALRPQPTWRRAAAMGVVVGMLIMVHQQRGAFMGLGAAACLVVEAVLARWYRDASVRPRLAQQLSALGAGALLVVVPSIGWLVLRAGFEPVWEAVVTYPLVNYRMRTRWGFGGGLTQTLPQLLAVMPVVLAVTVPRALALGFRRADHQQARALSILTVFSLFSILSVWYFPDFIHLAFIAPVFLVAMAEALGWALRLLPARAHRIVGPGVALALLAVIAWRLAQNLTGLPPGRPTFDYASAFGRVRIDQATIDWLEKLDALLDDVPSRTLYQHPNAGYTYLLLGARNPTRFEFVVHGYTSAKALQEVVGNLAAERPPYVITRSALVWPGDPIGRYIDEHYQPLTPTERVGTIIWQLQPQFDRVPERSNEDGGAARDGRRGKRDTNLRYP